MLPSIKCNFECMLQLAIYEKLIICLVPLMLIEGVGARRYQVTILSIWDNRHFYIIQIIVLLMLLFMADDTLVFVYFMHENRIG